METIDPRDVAKFDPQGHELHSLCRGPLVIATYQISKLWALWFQRRLFFFFFFSFFSIVSLRELSDAMETTILIQSAQKLMH